MSGGGLSEQWLIDTLIAAVGVPPTPYGPGDDAAVVDPFAGRRVVTADALVQGVHFVPAHPPAALGWKALAVNLSDVASMGARPEAFVLTAAVPEELPAAYWQAFARGLGECAGWGGAALVGGDTVRSPGPLTLSITAWGCCEGSLLSRSGGLPGDVVMVNGHIGRSALGLRRWLDEADGRQEWGADRDVEEPVLSAHLRPCPPLEAGPTAVALGAHAGMDLSDGLATDLPRLARASGVALAVDLERLPADPLLSAVPPAQRAAGGEDYGLLILAPPERVAALEQAGFAAIGGAGEWDGAGAPVVIWRQGGRRTQLDAEPFAHF